MRRLAIPTAVALAAFALAAACSDDPAPAPDYTDACAVLASQCHPYSKVSALGNECHELGHAGYDSACGPRKAECLAACPLTDASTAHETADTGTSDAAAAASDADASVQADAGDVCSDYCSCLMPTCGALSGYPYGAVEQCRTACGSFSGEQRSCWPKFCAQAKTSSSNTHACEHAWGKFDLDECETLP